MIIYTAIRNYDYNKIDVNDKIKIVNFNCN